MDYGMGTENLENNHDPQDSGDVFQPDHQDDEVTTEESGMTDETQPSEAETEKPKRRRKKSEEEPAQPLSSDDEQTDGAADENIPGDEESGLDEPDGLSPEDVDSLTGSPRQRERSLDGHGRIIEDRGDTSRHDLSMFAAARNARRILTATIDGIDTDGSSLPRVVFYVGAAKVLIPFAEMGMDLNPKEIEPGQAAGIIDSMLGAKIDYMVRGVDVKNKLVGASRREAMLLRRRTILNARQGDDFRIKVGTVATARILQVMRFSTLVEFYGYQTFIWRNQTSNLWVHDVREFVNTGEEKLVEVVELERNPDTGEVTHLVVSMKGAQDTPNTELRAGNTYTGQICSFSETAYYVRVTGVPMEVRCPINSNHVMEMMGTGDFVKFFVRGIYDGVPTGSIRRVVKKAVAGIR